MLASMRGLVKTILDRKWYDVKTPYFMSHYEIAREPMDREQATMPAGSHAGPRPPEEIPLAREPDGGLDIGDAGTARDERGMTIDRAVPDAACSVVLRVAGTDQLATKVACQVGEGRIVESGGGATLSLES
jgi:hypothetical protein